MTRRIEPFVGPILLLVVLAVAVFLRVWGMDYGLPFPTARPDEERIVGRAVRMLATGSLHPGDFTYPGLVKSLCALGLFLYAKIGALLGRYDKLWDFLFDMVVTRPGLQYRICRSVSIVFGVGTVAATYHLGRAAYARRGVGLLAAAAVATCLIHVRDSRFATVDVTMAFFVTVSLVFAVRAARGGRTLDFVLAGWLAGMAAGAKYNAGMVILGVLAAGWSLWRARSTEAGSTTARGIAYRLVLASLTMTAAFAVSTPYSLLHYRGVLRELQAIRDVLYEGSGPRAIWVHLQVTFPEGFGWPFFLAGVAGAVRALWLRRSADGVLLAFFLPSFASAAAVRWVFPRYLIPYAPLLGVWAAEFGFSVLCRSRALPAVAAAALLAGPGLVKSIAFDRVAARKDTRVLAAEWVAANIPPRTEILLCRGYGAPAINKDRRRPPAFAPRRIACTPQALASTTARYLITHEHPYLTAYSGVTRQMCRFLEQRATPRGVFDPFKPHRRVDPYFYPGDAFYLPLSHLEAMERGGPIVTIWELEAPR